MAGIAALMRTRKERERKRNESLHDSENAFSEMVTGKDGSEQSLGSRKSPSILKKSMSKQELLKKKSQSSLDSGVTIGTKKIDGFLDTHLRQSYSGVYIGLVLMAIGLVITFVGLGEKGFKTTELRLIGPMLCLSGFLCIGFKIIQCCFPDLFNTLNILRFRKNAKLSDSITDPLNSMEKGSKTLRNGHLTNNGSKNTNTEITSPRITLQSSTKFSRPQSTIPNFIDDSTDEEDDFDPGRSRPHSNRNSSFFQPHQHQQQQQKEQEQQQPKNKTQQYKNEILLNPKALML